MVKLKTNNNQNPRKVFCGDFGLIRYINIKNPKGNKTRCFIHAPK